MRRLALALTLLPALANAELKLEAEYPVEGIAGGNLSGLAVCNQVLQGVSDRDDDRIYRLTPQGEVMQAEAEVFTTPAAANSQLPWGMRMRNLGVSWLRGGFYDFEGLSCDAKGNRYLVSESHGAVLSVSPTHEASWLVLPPALMRQARASGMLLHFNQGYEGIAVSPDGQRLWLAAEQRRRGVNVLHKRGGNWRCSGGCVLFSEGGKEASPAGIGGHVTDRDFSGLAFYGDKLFTLERQAHRICRRNLTDGAVERCWSFAATALSEQRRYPVSHGMAEALWIDENGAWVGVDNGRYTRADGEARPIVWRFAAPTAGWSAKP